MADRLPPLNALRAFDAAARHLNMSRAADELAVTPAAVSHQVIALERYLGRKLFVRLQHGLALTPEGAAYLPPIREGFECLRNASKALDGRRGTLAIAVPPAFSAKWLMPRLNDLRAVLPSISIANEGANDPVDRLPPDIDVAIRYGTGRFAGVSAYRLLDEVVIPVCHPDLIAERPEDARLPDVLAGRLLRGRESLPGEGFPNWRRWFAWAGLDDPPLSEDLALDHHLMTVQAALEGQGIALAKRSIVMTDLARGNLVQLVGAGYPLAFAHYLAFPPETGRLGEVETLRDWLDAGLADAVAAVPPALFELG